MFVVSQTKRQNKSIGLISQKNNFARTAHLFVHFLGVVLHDYNVKLPETFGLDTQRFMEEMSYAFLFNFFHCPLIFTLVAVRIFHFRTAAVKFSCFSSKKISLLSFLSLALALSLLSTSMLTFKFNRKKDSSLLLFLSL